MLELARQDFASKQSCSIRFDPATTAAGIQRIERIKRDLDLAKLC